MTKKQKDPTPKKEHHASNVLVNQLMTEIRQMLVDLKPRSAIVEHIRSKYGKQRTQTNRYIARALKEHQDHTKDHLDDIRSQTQIHLLEQYNKMLSLHQSTGNSKYLRLSLEFYDRYVKLFPNSLQPEVVEQEGTINISFNKLGKPNE